MGNTTMTAPLVETVTHISGALAVLLFVYLALIVLSIIAAVKVVTKAGYSGWWVLIVLVPFVGFVMTLVFAFSEWPILREVKVLRAQVSSWSGYGPAPGYGGGAGFPPYPWGPTRPSGPVAGWPTPGVPSSGAPPTEWPETGPPLPPFNPPRRSAAPDQTPATDEGKDEDDTTAQPDHEPDAQASPGWYPTPDGRRRYWDGTVWTDHFA